MFDIGGGELLLILVVVLILFGPKRIPELAKSIGKGLAQIRRAQVDFQRGLNTLQDEVDKELTTMDLVNSKRTPTQDNATVVRPAAGSISRDASPAETETNQQQSTPDTETHDDVRQVRLGPNEQHDNSPQNG